MPSIPAGGLQTKASLPIAPAGTLQKPIAALIPPPFLIDIATLLSVS